jgi:hypothetical protein
VQLQYVMLYTVYWSGCTVTICYAVYRLLEWLCSYNMLCCIPFIGVAVQLQYVMLYTVYWSDCAVTICYAVYRFITSQLLSTSVVLFIVLTIPNKCGCFR